MINISSKGIAGLTKAVKGIEKDLKKNVAVAINDSTKFCKSQIAKTIQATGINVTQKVIKSGLIDSGRANAARLGVTVTLKKGFRFGLNAFKARAVKKGGVSYKISKTSGTKNIPNAFIPTRYGSGKVYIRSGKERGPLRQMRGISPWGVFVKNDKTPVIAKQTQAELEKQIQRRIRFLTLKAQGKI
jgi:hypothetical protein